MSVQGAEPTASPASEAAVPPQEASGAPSRKAEMLAGAASLLALGVLLAIIRWLAGKRLHVAFAYSAGSGIGWVASGLALLASAASVFLKGPWRLRVLLGVSIAACLVVLGKPGALVLAYAGGLCALARARLALRYQLAIAIAAWLALPVARAAHKLPPLGAPLTSTIIFWACLLYSAIYLLVERRRGSRLSLWQELFYLLAIPRLLEVLFQPLSPRDLFARERRLELRQVGQALLLGLYGAGLSVAAVKLKDVMWDFDGRLPVVFLDVLYNYCSLASHLSIAVALFRLMGFDLRPGFNRPFVSRSFAEFFQRWNYYVRDAVLSLFYFPLLGWLRFRVPKAWAKVLSGYLAIFIGSFLLNDRLVPMVTDISPLRGFWRMYPSHLPTLLVYWTATVLPSSGLAPVGAGKVRTDGRSRFLATARFLVLFGAIWVGSWTVTEYLRGPRVLGRPHRVVGAPAQPGSR